MASIFPKESVQGIAESVGVSLNDPAAERLIQEVEYRLREVIHEGLKFMRHAKRTTLTTSDLAHALALKRLEPMYGYSRGWAGTPPDHRGWEAVLVPGSTPNKVYYQREGEVELEAMIHAPLPPVPVDVSVTAHWLAVEGVQPRIVENPDPEVLAPSSSKEALAGGKKETAAPLVKEVLTKELQLYYEKVTESLMCGEEELITLAMDSVEQDPGIQALVPYFFQFMTDKITRHMKELPIMWVMMRLARSLLHNRHLFVEPYLHSLMPNIITCIVGKRLSASPTENHWDLREYAASLVSHISNTYGHLYPTLTPRVAKTLLKAFLDPSKALSTQYGAIVGLWGLGAQVQETLILPNLKVYGEGLRGKCKSDDATEQAEARRVLDRLVVLLREYVERTSQESTVTPVAEREYRAQFGIFAEGVFAPRG